MLWLHKLYQALILMQVNMLQSTGENVLGSLDLQDLPALP